MIIIVNLSVNFLMLISYYYVIPCHGACRLYFVLSIVLVHADLLFCKSICTSYIQCTLMRNNNNIFVLNCDC